MARQAVVAEVPVFRNGVERAVWTFLQGVQHLLACLGATIVAPLQMGINPAMAIFTSGLGTLWYVWRTGIPVYMGGSFAYITAIKEVNETYGQGAVAGGILTTAVVSIVAGLAVRRFGYRWITNLMPPIVTLNLLVAIGMVLAPVAIGMSSVNWGLAAFTMVAIFTIALALRRSELVSGLPILGGILVGYLVALFFLGQVDTSPVLAASFLTLPVLVAPVFVPSAMARIGSVAIATIGENIADMKALAAIFGHPDDLDSKIGVSLESDGIADGMSFVANPSTPYNESIGTTAVAYRPGLTMDDFRKVIYVAGVLAVSAGFMGWVTPLILSIPVGVLGGAVVILFGVISVLGPRLFVTLKTDFTDWRNIVVTVVMTFMWIAGAAGAKYLLFGYNLGPIVAVAVTGIVVNAALKNRFAIAVLLGFLVLDLVIGFFGLTPLFTVTVPLVKAVLYIAFGGLVTAVYWALVRRQVDLSPKAAQLVGAVIFTFTTAAVAAF